MDVRRVLDFLGCARQCQLEAAPGVCVAVGIRDIAHHDSLSLSLTNIGGRIAASVGDGLALDVRWGLKLGIALAQSPGAMTGLTTRRFAALEWDSRQQTLLAARDPLGTEPLFYAYLGDGGIAVSSSAIALLELRDVSREIDRLACAERLLSLPRGRGSTYFSQLCELPRASTLSWVKRTVTVKEYWRCRGQPVFATQTDAVERMRDTFKLSVLKCLSGARAPTVTLSGGLDSTSVFRVADLHLPGRVGAIAATFPRDPSTSEDYYLDLAVRGRESQLVRFEPKLQVSIHDLLRVAEDPQVVPMASIAISCAAKAKELGFDRVLTGELGDFVGGYASEPVRWLLRQGRYLDAWAMARAFGGGPTRCGIRFAHQWLLGCSNSMSAFRLKRTPQFRATGACLGAMSSGVRQTLGLDERVHETWFGRPQGGATFLEQTEQFLDSQGAQKIATSALAESLTGSRTEHPFSDPDLVDFTAGLAFEMRWYGGASRAALRLAMAGIIPEEVRTRRTKAFFNGPHGRYYREIESELGGPGSLWPLSELLELEPTPDGSWSASPHVAQEMLARVHVLAAWLRMHAKMPQRT